MNNQIPSSPSEPRDPNEKQSSFQEQEENNLMELPARGKSEPAEKQVKSEGQQHSSSTTIVVDEGEKKDHKNSEEEEEVTAENSGRERLKRHRKEVAGQVWIPEKWGKEELLEDWMDCSVFNASLIPTGIMSARAALIKEGQRPNPGGLRIENNRCTVTLSNLRR